MKTPWQIWRMPLLMAALLLFGLLSALLGVGLWHWASWLCMTIPVVLGMRHWFKA